MAYFNQEMKKELMNKLKEEFPDWAFSLKVNNHSTINVGIKRAPIDLVAEMEKKTGHPVSPVEQLNHYWLQNAFEGETLETMYKLMDIINLKGTKFANYDNSDIQTDYFDTGFYVGLRLGAAHDKPFEYVPPKLKKKKSVSSLI